MTDFKVGDRVRINSSHGGWSGPGTVVQIAAFGDLKLRVFSESKGRDGLFSSDVLTPADPPGLKRVKVSDLKTGDKFKFTEGDIVVTFNRSENRVLFSGRSGFTGAYIRTIDSDVFLVVPEETVTVTVPRSVAESYTDTSGPLSDAFKEALKK